MTEQRTNIDVDVDDLVVFQGVQKLCLTGMILQETMLEVNEDVVFVEVT